MSENGNVACDCPVSITKEDECVTLIRVDHRSSCPMSQTELPPLGVNVSDTSGVAGKVG
jgi:hypothetical protein